MMKRTLSALALGSSLLLAPACSSEADAVESSFDDFYTATVEEEALASIDRASDEELCEAAVGGDCDGLDLNAIRRQMREASTVEAAHRSYSHLCSSDDDDLKSYFVRLLQFASDGGLIDVDRLFPSLQDAEEPPRVRFDLVLLAAACPDRLETVASAERAAVYRDFVASA